MSTTATWNRQGHKVHIGPWMYTKVKDSLGRLVGRYSRPIYIDDVWVCDSRGKDLMNAKWKANEELERIIRNEASIRSQTDRSQEPPLGSA